MFRAPDVLNTRPVIRQAALLLPVTSNEQNVQYSKPSTKKVILEILQDPSTLLWTN